MSLWKDEQTWRTIGKAYGLMKKMNAGFRTQFVQAAYAECWVAYKLTKAGYDVKFHEGKCDLSLSLHDSHEPKNVRIEIKHSEDNKDKDKKGHGYSSWVISGPQVDDKKFDLCILVRGGLTKDDPDATYVFSLKEIANTKPVDVNPGRLDYYLWYSEYFGDICDEWMRNAANPLVESLNKNPSEFEERWNKILNGDLRLILKNT